MPGICGLSETVEVIVLTSRRQSRARTGPRLALLNQNPMRAAAGFAVAVSIGSVSRGTGPHPTRCHFMKRRNTELSNAAILSISGTVGIVGLVAYLLASPLTPAQRIALGHAAVSEVLTR